MDKLQEQEKRKLELLVELSVDERFKNWKDFVVKPVIDQLEEELANPLELSEANLKAKLMHLNSIKYLFDKVFIMSKQTLDSFKDTK